ncbi:EAL domain-containing protein [Actinoplanes sp. NPDC048796]|uniref:putative bifunctional diguanylate cyclase/phosphodiesterase n=1 Tax=Actinoplanes sp. NPDC048796 TaxID=3155640 RepID=UPI0033D58404
MSLLPDRLLRANALLLLVTVVAVGVNSISPVIPWALLWLPSIAGAGLLAVSCARTARAEHLPAPIRLFWRQIWVVCLLVGLGATAQTAQVTRAGNAPDLPMGAGQMVFDGLAILIIMWALIRLPFGSRSRGETFRLVLDAGTVMLACAVFVWHFATRYSLHAADSSLVYVSLTLSVVALLAVFAVAKFLLASQSLFDRGALRMLAVAVLIGAVGPILRPIFMTLDPHLYPDVLGMPAVYFFGALAANRQRRASYGPRRGAKPSRPRSFSALPYVAVGAVDGLLLTVAWPANGEDRRIVVVSAVLLTALVVLRQITAFRDNGRLLRRLDHGATHDALTRLPNRVLFHERLDKALTSPGDRPVAVALIDLDDFKEVNDTLGHEVGDLLLIAVAQRLDACVRAEDTVARLGGDEFVLVLDGADPAAADLAARRMIEALREPVVADGHELPIRASIGIADGRSGDDPSLLLRRADIAMYAAKARPGTTFLHYDQGMAASDQSHLGAELREAIRDDQLFLLYQPIVSLTDDRVLGAEALVRWAHPVHGTLAPDAFIPVAERTGLIVPLGRWVIRRAVRDLAGWNPAIVLNINISARDLREPGFAFYVGALLDAYEIEGSRIALEVTESMPIDAAASAANLTELRARGVRVSLDDFGTGASTLTMLHDVPVDEVKLDRAFTQAAPDDRVPVAAAVLQVAGALGLDAVAEGVETCDQAQRLRDLGYRAAQGFLFARPMPAADFAGLLERDWPSGAGVMRTA